MKASRVARIDPYRDPTESAWKAVPSEAIALMATPLAMQPTAYIQNAWKDRPYGQCSTLNVSCVHDGSELAVRLRWSGVSAADGDFPDALAIAMPVRGEPALALMGQPDAPIHILRWQANKPQLRSILATGIGKSLPGPQIKGTVKAQASGDEWQLVITRALGHGKDIPPLVIGKPNRFGFAVWKGANDERAGVKAFSIDWTPLVLQA